VIGAAHAGWRGAVAGVLEATVAAMERLGARRGRIAAVIGPCIAQASYEVRADLREAVGDARFFAPGRDAAHFQFDLAAYCAQRLAGIGRVEAMGLDTLAEEARFFSHRRRTLAGGGPLGHQLSAIVL
jgi:copper oxidase (laccase) domain-containing protein